MQQSVEMLLKKMSEDKAFAEKVLSQTEKEKVIEVAKGEGIELTIEGIDEANEIIAKALQLQSEGELSEEDLENVAGGTMLMTASIIISGAVTLSTIASVSMIVSTAMTASASAAVSAMVSAAVSVEK